MIKDMKIGTQGSHKTRHGSKGLTWGENGAVRTTTKEYRDGWDLIFSKKKSSEEIEEVCDDNSTND